MKILWRNRPGDADALLAINEAGETRYANPERADPGPFVVLVAEGEGPSRKVAPGDPDYLEVLAKLGLRGVEVTDLPECPLDAPDGDPLMLFDEILGDTRVDDADLDAFAADYDDSEFAEYVGALVVLRRGVA